jgi:1-acyl-sn-glycerol-3-phosphate acyltransferase
MILARILFFALVLRPSLALFAGINLLGREHLPAQGPAILAANHNSHLDAPAIMAMFPLAMLGRLRPVIAGDYFDRSCNAMRLLASLFGVISFRRDVPSGHRRFIEECSAALRRGEILILFPEGTRGEPERRSACKCGIGHLARRHPKVPVIPVFLRGFGRVLPRGARLPVPHFCAAAIGSPLYGGTDVVETTRAFNAALSRLEHHLLCFQAGGAERLTSITATAGTEFNGPILGH